MPSRAFREAGLAFSLLAALAFGYLTTDIEGKVVFWVCSGFVLLFLASFLIEWLGGLLPKQKDLPVYSVVYAKSDSTFCVSIFSTEEKMNDFRLKLKRARIESRSGRIILDNNQMQLSWRQADESVRMVVREG